VEKIVLSRTSGNRSFTVTLSGESGKPTFVQVTYEEK
jgi:hypothetical protein